MITKIIKDILIQLKKIGLLLCGLVILIGILYIAIELRNVTTKQNTMTLETFNSHETVRQDVISFEKVTDEDEFIWRVNTGVQPDIFVYIRNDTNGIELKSFPSSATEIYKTLEPGETPYVIYDDYEYKNIVTNVKLYLPKNSYHTILNAK